MAFLLVEDRQSVLLGPMDWRQRFFQGELDDLEVDYKVPPVLTGYLRINDQLEIFPIVESTVPEHDPQFDQLAGPFWTFDNEEARGIYTRLDLNIDVIKSNLKNIAAAGRYRRENTPTTVTVQGTAVTLDVSRDNRNIFVQKYMMMGDADTVGWKFPETWLTLSKAELGSVIATGAAYIQAQFDWEKSIADSIDAASTADELKAIVIVEPVAPTTPMQGI
jgi:hypothetical protein